MSQTPRDTHTQPAERSELDRTGQKPRGPWGSGEAGGGFHSRRGRSGTHGALSLHSDWTTPSAGR